MELIACDRLDSGPEPGQTLTTHTQVGSDHAQAGHGQAESRKPLSSHSVQSA